MNFWQYEHGVCTNNAYNVENEHKLLSWILINGCCIHALKLVFTIKTLKFGTEAVDCDLSHCSQYYYM